jgi:hypothetical protein
MMPNMLSQPIFSLIVTNLFIGISKIHTDDHLAKPLHTHKISLFANAKIIISAVRQNVI